MTGSSMRAMIIAMMFMFSTVYTLSVYYYAASGVALGVEGLDDKDTIDPYYAPGNTTWLNSVVVGSLDFVLDVFSWFSPFALVKGLLLVLVPPKLYIVLNMLILRPVGWVATWITTEWVINKLRGTGD